METLFVLVIGIAIGIGLMAMLRPAPETKIVRAFYRKGQWVSQEDHKAKLAEFEEAAKTAVDEAVKVALKKNAADRRAGSVQLVQFCLDVGRKISGQNVAVIPTHSGVRLVKTISATEVMEVVITPDRWRVVSGQSAWDALFNKPVALPASTVSEETRPSLPAPRTITQKTVIQQSSNDPMDDPNYWAAFDQQ